MSVTDEELVERYCATNDQTALTELIARYTPPLRRLIYTIVGSDGETEMDAEQEVLVTMVAKLDRFRAQSSFATFFYRLARNRVIDLLRRKHRHNNRVVAFEDPDRITSRGMGPEHQTIRDETVAQVRNALSCLGPDDRFLLYMKDGEGLKVEELSELSGLGANTVKSRLARARRRVAARLEEMGYEPE